MRWFKHLTDAHSDEKMASIMDDCGLEGYGFYWLIAEIVAKQMDSSDKCDATYSLPQWSRLCYSHHHKVSNLLGKLEVTGLIATERVDGKIKVIIPNLLKFRDEYSKKSGQTPSKNPDIVRSKKQKQKQKQNKEEDLKQTPLPPKGERDELFDEFWTVYPKKIGKDAARKAWDKREVDPLLSAKMVQAIERQRMSEQWMRDNGQYIPHPATWLNQGRWKDEAPAPQRKEVAL